MYVLHRLSLKPAHGYELLREIEAKTKGDWRPGPGALYPLLKKMIAAGYIEPIQVKGEVDQKVYSITPKGISLLESSKMKIYASGQRMESLRRIVLEMMGAEQALDFLVRTTKGHFEMIRAAYFMRSGRKPNKEILYLMREYCLVLDRETHWAKQETEALESSE